MENTEQQNEVKNSIDTSEVVPKKPYELVVAYVDRMRQLCDDIEEAVTTKKEDSYIVGDLEYVKCADTDNLVLESVAHYVEDLDVFYENIKDIVYLSGRWYSKDCECVVYCEDSKSYGFTDDVYYVRDLEQYYKSNDKLVYVEGSGWFLKDGILAAYCEDTGKYELMENAHYIQNLGKYYKHTEGFVKLSNGCWYSEDYNSIAFCEDLWGYTFIEDTHYIEDLGIYYYDLPKGCFKDKNGRYWSSELAYKHNKEK
jgi:hypothetical protein